MPRNGSGGIVGEAQAIAIARQTCALIRRRVLRLRALAHLSQRAAGVRVNAPADINVALPAHAPGFTFHGYLLDGARAANRDAW